jgi:hypothetical protein
MMKDKRWLAGRRSSQLSHCSNTELVTRREPLEEENSPNLSYD